MNKKLVIGLILIVSAICLVALRYSATKLAEAQQQKQQAETENKKLFAELKTRIALAVEDGKSIGYAQGYKAGKAAGFVAAIELVNRQSEEMQETINKCEAAIFKDEPPVTKQIEALKAIGDRYKESSDRIKTGLEESFGK